MDEEEKIIRAEVFRYIERIELCLNAIDKKLIYLMVILIIGVIISMFAGITTTAIISGIE